MRLGIPAVGSTYGYDHGHPLQGFGRRTQEPVKRVAMDVAPCGTWGGRDDEIYLPNQREKEAEFLSLKLGFTDKQLF